jgi:hypothetical protein
MVLIEQIEEGGFPAFSRVFERIHRYLNSITLRTEKESHQKTFSHQDSALSSGQNRGVG